MQYVYEYHYGYTLPSEYHYTTANWLYIAYILPVGIFDVPVNYGTCIYILYKLYIHVYIYIY